MPAVVCSTICRDQVFLSGGVKQSTLQGDMNSFAGFRAGDGSGGAREARPSSASNYGCNGSFRGTRTESNFGAAPPDFAHSFPKAARHYQPRPGSAYGRGMAGRTVSAPAGAVEHQFQLLQVDRCGWHNSDFHGGSGSIASQGSDTALQHVHAHHQSSAPRGRLHLGVANEPAFASSTPCSTPTLGCPERMTTDDATPTIENQPTFMNWSSDATASPVGIFQSQGTPLPALADGALPQIHRSALYRRRLRRNASIHAQESLVVAASRISLSEPRR